MALSVQPVTSLTSTVSTPSIRNSRAMTAKPNQNLNTKFVIDWNNPAEKPKTPNNNNLQEAFHQFRQQRMDEIKLQQCLEVKRKKKVRRSNPDRMYRLRLKFVEQAKRYLGVPYARKYFQPGTPEYNSKLFLDCCGLVRRVMYDLAQDFGFIIGPWNQSYMYDTLPKTITHLSDVKPGDLVFISATYYNTKMKKQRHNLTHVEIMLGDGEKTIGARWNNGKVQFFDSYKFVSKSYHSQIYTIKSLDPWLKGICQSYCPDHRWRRRKPINPNKKSIFYSSNDPHQAHHHRSHSHKPTKGTPGSASSSSNSSNKKVTHRRKRRRRTKRSKSNKRSNSAKLSPESTTINANNENVPLSASLNGRSISDEDEDDECIDNLSNQLAEMNCQGEEELCDDSDSLDEALDAEHLDDDDANMNEIDLIPSDIKTDVQ